MFDERMMHEQDKKGGTSNLIIDIATLKKLLNRGSCEFILALVQGSKDTQDKNDTQMNQKT